VQLYNGKLEVHMVVLQDFEFVQVLKDAEHVFNAAGDVCAEFGGRGDVNSGPVENPPEAHDLRAQTLDRQVELFVQLVHLDEVLSIEIAFLLIL